MKFYFLGIKGSGMAALALILKGIGHEVRGADIESYIFTEENLKKKNIEIDSFKEMKYEDCDYIVVGNSFIDKYKFKDKNVIGYQELIAELEKKCYSIAVCGTHGKTTTANMIKCVLDHIFPCSYLIGDGQGKGVINASYFIYEACEHRDHFLAYHPNMIVCTNVDYDHVEYFKNKTQYNNSFYRFFSQASDRLILANSINYKSDNITNYGYNVGNIRAKNVKFETQGVTFDLYVEEEKFENIFLPLFGKTLFIDALACIACCSYLNIDIPTIIKYLSNYKKASRRMNIKTNKSNVIVDDYGHHPEEIKATIEALKQIYPSKKMIIIYHPDRPKRLMAFINKYEEIFNSVEKTYILPFLNNNEEEKQALSSIVNNSKILNFSDELYNNKYEDTIFLFTGSKEMTTQINNLENHL